MKRGWQKQRLGDVCEVIKGRKPDLRASPLNGDLPYLVAKVMRGSEEPQYASPADRNSITVSESDTIIICDGSNSGEIFVGFRGILSSTMGKVSRKVEIDDNYLRAFLVSTFEVFNRAKTGAAIPHLDKDAMYRLELSAPPLPEQRRIAGILDEALRGISCAKLNAERNQENASVLLYAHLENLCVGSGEDWVEKTVGDVCELAQGLAINKTTKHLLVPKSALPLLRIKDLRENTEEQYVSESGFPKAALVNEEDILYTRTGNSLGLVFTGRRGVLHNNSFKVIPKQGMQRGYLFWWLQRPSFKNRIFQLASKAAQPDITHSLFKAQTILVPPLDYQRKATEALMELSEETRQLESIYHRKVEALDALKRSLLHAAFSGQL
jgi:type I restriction enzyme S subunit